MSQETPSDRKSYICPGIFIVLFETKVPLLATYSSVLCYRSPEVNLEYISQAIKDFLELSCTAEEVFLFIA